MCFQDVKLESYIFSKQQVLHRSLWLLLRGQACLTHMEGLKEHMPSGRASHKLTQDSTPQPWGVPRPPEDIAHISLHVLTIKPAKSEGSGKGQLKFTVKGWGNKIEWIPPHQMHILGFLKNEKWPHINKSSGEKIIQLKLPTNESKNGMILRRES